DDPRHQIAVGDLLADVGLLGPGCEVPVDPADVVAGVVDPCFTRLAAVARGQALMVTMENAVEAPVDLQFEAPQHLGDRRVGGSGRPGERTAVGISSPKHWA